MSSSKGRHVEGCCNKRMLGTGWDGGRYLLWCSWKKVTWGTPSELEQWSGTSDGQSEACTEVSKQSESHLHSDTCWPIWLLQPRDNLILWNRNTDKSSTIPNKATYSTRLSIMVTSTHFGEIPAQTRQENIEPVATVMNRDGNWENQFPVVQLLGIVSLPIDPTCQF